MVKSCISATESGGGFGVFYSFDARYSLEDSECVNRFETPTYRI